MFKKVSMSIVREIGRGTDGVIFLTGKDQVKKQFFSKKQFDMEKIVKNFSHPHITRPIKISNPEMTIYYPLYKKFETVKWTITTATKMLFQIIDALCEIQKKGYLYTDVSPNNIMVDSNGDFVLIDFASVQKLDSIEGVHANETFVKKIQHSKCRKSATAYPFEFTVPCLLLVATLELTKVKMPKLVKWVKDNCPTVFALRYYLFSCMVEDPLIKKFDLKYRLSFMHTDVPLPPMEQKKYEKQFLK